MQQLAVVLVLLLVAAVATTVAQGDRYREVKQINPIMRYWANSRLRRKLPLLEEMAARKKQEAGGDSLKYRNCFFSPVQCQLPVLIERDPLVSALKIETQPNFLRFRRFP